MPASYTAVMEAPRTAGSFKTVRHNARLKRRWTRAHTRFAFFHRRRRKRRRRMAAQRNAGRLPAARPYQRRTAPNICGGLRIRPPRKRCGDAAAESAVSAEGGSRTAAAPARQTRQTRHSRRFKSTRRDQRHDTIPSESRRAFLHRFSSARRRYAGRLRGYAAHPLRSGGLRAVPRRRVGRRGGGARALFPAGADGHALRPAAAEAYAESGGNRPLRFLLCGVRFWAETAGFALLCLLLPSGWLFAGLPVLLPDRGLCLALLLPLLFLLQLPARLSAFRASAG